jgi:hypothetical protein
VRHQATPASADSPVGVGVTQDEQGTQHCEAQIHHTVTGTCTSADRCGGWDSACHNITSGHQIAAPASLIVADV